MIKPDQAVNMVANFEDRKKAGVSVVWFNSNKIKLFLKSVTGTSAHELVHEALKRWSTRGMRADNSSAIVVFIEKKKMEPKNGGTAAYTEKWTSANKNEHKKEELESDASSTKTTTTNAKPTIERKPLKEVTPQITPDEATPPVAKSLIGRKRPSSENNNENNVASSSNSSSSSAATAAKKSKLTFTASKVQRRRSTRIAVKRCEHGLTRSAARKRASL